MIIRRFFFVYNNYFKAARIIAIVVLALLVLFPQNCYSQGIAEAANSLIGQGGGGGGAGAAICKESTKRLFDADDDGSNNLQSAQDAYLASVSDLIATECLVTGTNELQSCLIDLSEINYRGEESEYAWECIEGSGNTNITNSSDTNTTIYNNQTQQDTPSSSSVVGVGVGDRRNGINQDDVVGILWHCNYQPQCSPSGAVTLEIKSLLICASSKCSLGGVTQTLIPHASLLGPLNDAGHACAAIFRCSLAFE